MALSKLLDGKAGVVTQPSKIITISSEKCLSPENCQYWVDERCSLEECPFISPREMNAPETIKSDGTQDKESVNNALRKCCLCGTKYKGFIGAVPLCSTCLSRLRKVIAQPYCPGCGAAVSEPHMICSSCKAKFEDIGEL